MRRPWFLILAVACASPQTPEQPPVEFGDAPVMEPEAGPAPEPVVVDAGAPKPVPVEDAGVAEPEVIPDTGAPAVLDAGPADTGVLTEPLLTDEALRKRFEAAMALALDKPADAVAEFDAIAAAAPDFYFAPYNAALCRMRSGDLAGGEAGLVAVHDRFGSKYHGATEALAWLRFNRGDSESGLAMLRKAMDDHPLVLSLRNAVGRMLLETGGYEEAGDLAMKTLKKDEVNVGAMQVLGWSFCQRNKMELCLLVLGNALKVPGEEGNGMTNYLAALAYLKFAEGAQKLVAEARVRTAERYLEAAAIDMPDRPEVLINQALVLLRTGDPGKALVMAKRAAALRPDLVEARMAMAVAQRDTGKYAESRKSLLAILKDKPEQRDVYYNLGILFLDHDLARVEGEELCPDVSMEDLKQNIASDLFDGAAVTHLDTKLIDPLQRLSQAVVYLERFNQGGEISPERATEVENQLRAAKKAIRKETKRRSRAISRAAREKKKAERRRKKMEREAKRREKEEAEKRATEEAAAAEAAAAQPEGAAAPSEEVVPADPATDSSPSNEPAPSPVDAEPSPVDPEPAPVDLEPTPVDPEPSPVDPEPTPVDPEPTPSVDQPEAGRADGQPAPSEGSSDSEEDEEKDEEKGDEEAAAAPAAPAEAPSEEPAPESAPTAADDDDEEDEK